MGIRRPIVQARGNVHVAGTAIGGVAGVDDGFFAAPCEVWRVAASEPEGVDTNLMVR